jgi:hypothetical protein
MGVIEYEEETEGKKSALASLMPWVLASTSKREALRDGLFSIPAFKHCARVIFCSPAEAGPVAAPKKSVNIKPKPI